MCVRMDREAVYLGRPSPRQRCPAHAVGRRRAILIDGRERPSARPSTTGAPVRLAAAGQYTGLGFDACTAPSKGAMSAWGRSPYRAIGVYIGGLNRGCSQPNLTSSWVREQVAAGWHLIPTYVGLQSPTSSCGSCAKLSPGSAAAQGAGAARDAVADAKAIGIGSGSPIYFDMESYVRASSATASTLTFLAAWTEALHAAGYGSGVYSSSASGIADLASKWRTAYPVPDDLWIANWNGAKSTDDPYVPDSAWSPNRRIHQYRGGHNETYGGVTINIDNNYVDGATVGSAATTPTATTPRGSARVGGVAVTGPGEADRLGLRPEPADRTDRDPRLSRRAQGGAGRAALRPRRGRQPSPPRHRDGAPQGRPQPRIRRQLPGRRLATEEGMRLRCRAGRREQAARLSHGGHPGAPPHFPSALRARQAAAQQSTAEWPAGVRCPGQILLRTRMAKKRRGAAHLVTVRIARRRFALTGGASHRFAVPLNSRGRRLARLRGTMRAQLIVAIPGGRLTHSLTLR